MASTSRLYAGTWSASALRASLVDRAEDWRRCSLYRWKYRIPEDGPEMEVLAIDLLDEGIDASPAVVGDQMFLRGGEHLYCIGRD